MSGVGYTTLLYKVAEVVLKIPHSNAEEECILSLIDKNKH